MIRALAITLLLIGCAVCVPGQSAPGSADTEVKRLFDAERWRDLVTLAEKLPTPSADVDYYYGSALAHLDRWEEARETFRRGKRLQPEDKRFSLELAGVAFRMKNYPEAARELRRALTIDPEDSYANDFLGSVFYLEGNLDAALKYWNRVGKPQIEQVGADPPPKVDPALLDRAFAFSPATMLQRSEMSATETRVQGLCIFPQHSFDLQAGEDGKFNIVFRNQERNGWGQNKWEGLFRIFRGLPFQTVDLDLYNLDHSAVNLDSSYRWDAQKRRVMVDLSGPIRRDPRWRYRIGTDLRGENWNILTSFTGPAALLGALNLRREAVSAEVTSFNGGNWRWSMGAEISHRDFRDVFTGVSLTPELVAKGYQLKHVAELDSRLWHSPERRLSMDGTLSSQIGRLWSQPEESFAKVQASLKLHWFPLAQGDDYELQENVHAGKTFGDVPFDELFMLGLMRDNDLWMRAHIGTRDGKKGSAPLGRNFFLSNWEIDKNVYRKGPLLVKVGPFVDTGRITDPSPGLGSGKWLCDIGVQAKPRLLGVSTVFSYGKDLRSGRNAFYVTLGR